MLHNFGEFNPALTNALRGLANDSRTLKFTRHAESEMDNDDFDHEDVLTCIRRGKTYGPEVRDDGRSCANVIHRGLCIRVVVGIDGVVGEDWSTLKAMVIVTVMRTT